MFGVAVTNQINTPMRRGLLSWPMFAMFALLGLGLYGYERELQKKRRSNPTGAKVKIKRGGVTFEGGWSLPDLAALGAMVFGGAGILIPEISTTLVGIPIFAAGAMYFGVKTAFPTLLGGGRRRITASNPRRRRRNLKRRPARRRSRRR